MNKQFEKLTKALLLLLVSIPILLIVGMVVAAALLITGTAAAIAVGVALIVLLIVPVIVSVVFAIVYFSTSNTLFISVRTEAKKYKFIFHEKIKNKNLIKVVWLNVKDEKKDGVSWAKAAKRGYAHFIETEFKPFWGQKIKANYGLEAHDAFMNATLKDMDFSISNAAH